MKKKNIKKILIVILVIILIFISILGVRYLRYNNYIGRFVSDSGDYYQFSLFGWSHSEDGTDNQKCNLWDCNIENGSKYYTKNNKLYLRFNKSSLFITNYKIEKKNNKTYLYFYDDSNELEYTYVKTN